ncbi:hypothetical protein [Nocardia abscessus]|uniref:hypothetical protein n=1 Tax=Nocardia abscessus TaxID=120957 RepID=UPI0002DAB755|nr:hypothetical protein [Nocardia abscessus]MCC3327509.1 hypothetical protein [Nocardia abscessus]
MIAALTAQRDVGGIAAPADIGALAPTLIGTAHLLFADREAGPPRREAVGVVAAPLAATEGSAVVASCAATSRPG